MNNPAAKAPPSRLGSAVLAIGLTLGFGALALLAAPWLGEGYSALLLVVGISVVGALRGLMPALVSAVTGSLLFDFFVSEPVFELSFDRSSDVATPLVFLLCAVISGLLSGRLSDEAARARRLNRQLENMLEISRVLQQASSEEDVITLLQSAQPDRQYALYLASGNGLRAIGPSPDAGQVQQLAGELVARAGEWQERGQWTACGLVAALDSAPQTDSARAQHAPIGVMVAANLRQDHSALMAEARIVALALERIALGNRLSEARAASRTEELKSALLASVSHDLRSPLTAISTAAASLQAFGPQFDQETSAQLLAGIIEESDRLNHLTTNLLQMTRLQSGQEEWAWSDLPVCELLRAIINRKPRNLREDGPDAQRPIRFDAPGQELIVRSDAALFDLVITNVLQNAQRYSPPGSPIDVVCTAKGAECVISITDQGIGIAPEEQERVFERFYRAPSGQRIQRGTGLGLAIARGFVEASGGSISIISPVADGKGTTLVICLPLALGAGAQLLER